MSLVSQETWDNMPEEEKKKIRDEYNNRLMNSCDKYVMERIFGKDNLQPEGPKTWTDVLKAYPKCRQDVSKLTEITVKTMEVLYKITATYKISKLIELGYGGLVTAYDWKNAEEIWYVIPDKDNNMLVCLRGLEESNKLPYFVAFHSKRYADEFVSYPENVKLVEEYYYDEYRTTK